MICSQCTAELPVTAAACPECGSNMAQGQSTTFSYLPPGAPPWPARVPEQLPYLVDSRAGASSPPAAVKAKAKRGTRRGAVARRIVGVVLILLITPVVGVLSTLGVLSLQGQMSPSHSAPASLSHMPSANPFASNSSDSLPPPANFKLTTDTSMNISLQYPSDWTAGPADQSSDPIEYPVTQPDKLIRMYIARFSSSLSSQISGPDELNSALIGQMSQQFTGVTPVASPSNNPSIGSDQWMEQDATYMGQDNKKSHFTTITVLHDHQNYYNINFVMPESLYQQGMQEYIQPILTSFRFTS